MTTNNPFAITMSPLHYQAFVAAMMELTGIEEDDAQKAVRMALGKARNATYAVAMSLEPTTLAPQLIAVGLDVDAHEVGRFCALGRCVDLATPVVQHQGRSCFPFRVVGQVVTVAKPGDMWNGQIVPEPPRTQFQVDPYRMTLVGPDVTVLPLDGSELPIGDERIATAWPLHQLWQDALASESRASLSELVGVLLHHPDSRWITNNGQRQRLRQVLTTPEAAGVSASDVRQAVFRAVGWWKGCYNAYAAACESGRKVAMVGAAPAAPMVSGGAGGVRSLSPALRRELVDMLHEMGSPSEFHRWLGYADGMERIQRSLPDPHRTAPAEFVDDLINELLAARRLDVLMQILCDERPYRQAQITDFKRKLGL